MIDISKTYQTKSGKRVVNIIYTPFNSNGQKVTYPIKGSIVLKEKPIKLNYQIWSEEGIYDIVYGSHPELNLMEIN